MGGSNSIKVVLPAVISSSPSIQKTYSKGLQSANVTSLNFPKNHVWLHQENSNYINPYQQLPPVFDNYTEAELEGLISEIYEMNNGGAELTAYGKLQYTDMSAGEREALTNSLLKYCELDTLAMVMIYQHFKYDLPTL